MKRVFILLLVLVIVSVVSAAPQIMVDGDKDPAWYNHINPTGNFTLGIWTDAAIGIGNGEGYLALVVNTSYSTIDYTSGFGVPPYDTDPGIFLEHSMSAADIGFPLPAGEDGILGFIFPMNINQINPDAVIFNGINLHTSPLWGELLGVTVKLYMTADFETSTLVDTAFLITPEPMTIGLLGLGALFLRRRKS